MLMFKRLTDPALKRLYKFVLKRVIGRFLLDELDLDQLDVHFRAGQLELCDLALDVQVLNTYLVGLPFHIQSGYLGSVKASISYSNIVTESCVIEIDDIDLVFVPTWCSTIRTNEEEETSSASASIRHHLSSRVVNDGDEEADDDASSGVIPNVQVDSDATSREGLDFVANWIEQISSKIKLRFSNIHCRFQPTSSSSSNSENGHGLEVHVKWAEFSDETPFDQSSSMTSSAMDYGISYKGIKFTGLQFVLNKDNIILQKDMSRKCYIKLNLAAAGGTTHDVPQIDVDVFLHAIHVQLEPAHCKALTDLLIAFCTPGGTGADENNLPPSRDLFYSVCQQSPPAWLTNETENESSRPPSDAAAAAGGEIQLSFTEFQRIEAILQQHHQMTKGGRIAVRDAGNDDIESVESDLEEFFECETDSVQPHPILSSSLAVHHRRMDTRIKVHVLDCQVELVYKDRCPEKERMLWSGRDILCCYTAYPTSSTCSVTFGSVDLHEKRFSCLDEGELLEIPIVLSSIELSIQWCFKTDEASTCHIKASPLELEYDVSILKRFNTFLSVCTTAAASTNNGGGDPSPSWLMEFHCDKIQLSVRFPLVASDANRYGIDANRELCQDQFRFLFSQVQVLNGTIHCAGIQFELYRPSHGDQHSRDYDSGVVVFSTAKSSISIAIQSPTTDELLYATQCDPTHRNFMEHETTLKNQRDVAQRIEATAVAASSVAVEIHVSQMSLAVDKPVYDRVLILLDALLSVDYVPLEDFIEDEEGDVAQPSLMSLVLTVQDGRIAFNTDEYVVECQELKLFHITQFLGRPISRMHLECQQMNLFEYESGIVLTKRQDDRARTSTTASRASESARVLEEAPVLCLMIEMNDMSAEMREVTLSITFHGLVLKYKVESCWLFNLLAIVLIEYPSAIVPAHDLPLGHLESLPIIEERPVFTKLFVDCLQSVVEYSPPKRTARLALVFGSFQVSSNLLSNATMQGYKFLSQDIRLFVTESSTATAASSAATVFDENEFLQLGMLDHADVFLNQNQEEHVRMEISLGLATFFTCTDSFQTLMELIEFWWEEYSTIPTTAAASTTATTTASTLTAAAMDDSRVMTDSTAAAAYVGVRRMVHKDDEEGGQTKTATAALTTEKVGGASILSEIDEHAFASRHRMLTDTQERMRQTLLDNTTAEKKKTEHRMNQMVIEDYYTMSNASGVDVRTRRSVDSEDQQQRQRPGAAGFIPDTQSPWFATDAADDDQDDGGDATARWYNPVGDDGGGDISASAAPSSSVLSYTEASIEEDGAVGNFQPLDEEDEDEDEDQEDQGVFEFEQQPWWNKSAAPCDIELQDNRKEMAMSFQDMNVEVEFDSSLQTELCKRLHDEEAMMSSSSEDDEDDGGRAVEEKKQDEEDAQEEEAKWYPDPKLRIYPHHIEIPLSGKAASTLSFGEKETKFALDTTNTTNATVLTHVILRDFSIKWRLFGGHDWSRSPHESTSTSSRQTKQPQQPRRPTAGEKTATKKSTDGSNNSNRRKSGQLLDALLDNYIPQLIQDDDNETDALHAGVSAKSVPTPSSMLRDPRVRRPSAHTKSTFSGRKTEQMLEIMLHHVQFRLDQFLPAQPLAYHVVFNVGELEVLDYISTSQIRKMICYWKSETIHPRETGTCMIRVHLMAIRPGANLCLEHRFKCRLLPLRINLDQDVIDFLRDFFTFSAETTQTAAVTSSAAAVLTSTTSAASVASSPPQQHGYDDLSSPSNRSDLGGMIFEEDTNVGAWFFQSCDIRACKIKIDYRPERVDYTALRAGDYFEVINLFVLEGMELTLRHVKLNGIDGWSGLAQQVLMSWINDISRHQIHKCVASVSMPPLRSFANLGSGAADLILLPMEQYSKDRRVVKGIKRGAHSFLKTVTIETLNTVSKVARGTQALLEHADDVVGSDTKKKGGRGREKKRRNVRRGNRTNAYLASQPAGAKEGLTQAYSSISREIQTAANTIIAVPMVEFQKTGPQGYVKSVIRAVPVAVLRPMIGATEAVSRALLGVRNQVDPEMKEDMENKFKDYAA